MVRISKHPLSQQDIQRLEKQFARIIARLNTTTSDPFMSDLLGTEEKIMLLKRLAAIVMYHERYSSYKVWTTLKISPDTANVIRTKFTQGQYANIQKQFTTQN